MPFVNTIKGILGDLKTWGFMILLGITVVKIVKEGIIYQQGDGRGKQEAMENIKSAIYMGGGLYAIVWFAEYVISKMAR